MKKYAFLFIIALSVFVPHLYSNAEEFAIKQKPVFENIKVDSDGFVNIKISCENNYNDYYDDYYKSDDEVEEHYYKATKYELYRSEKTDGVYELINTVQVSSSGKGVEFKDSAVTAGNTYYYKARLLDDSVTPYGYSDYNDAIAVTAVPTPGAVKYVRATKAKTFTILWNKTDGVDGYNIYMKEFDNQYLYGLHNYGKWVTDGLQSVDYNMPEVVENMEYTYIGSVKADALSYKYNKASHGKGYLFAIRSYKNVNGKKIESTTMYEAHGVMDYYFCINAENTKFKYKWPKNEKQARKACSTIKIKTWDYKNRAKHSGAKYTKTIYLTVNKKFAPTVKEIFKEIYKDKTKPPIYEAGSFRWRPEESTWSYHTVGTAIDMNCNENPMYKFSYTKKGKLKKKIIVGSFYKPKTNPYSIPRYGVVENTFEKYGFERLEHDLMHFNAIGIYSSSNY